MLFMIALSVSFHFNCFWRGWIFFFQTKGVEPGEKFSSSPSPLPSPLLAARGFPVVPIEDSRQENVQNGDELYSLSYIG